MAQQIDPVGQLNFLELLEVRQKAFEGPLALLLELIKKHQVEIHEIRLAQICAPYQEFLSLMESFDLEVAVEFLDIASTLVLIKSRALLPILEPPTEEEGENPEEELKRKLVAYQENQRLSLLLGGLPHLGRDFFTRPFDLELAQEEVEEELTDLTSFRLLEAYRRITVKRGFKKPHQVAREEFSVKDRVLELLGSLSPKEHRRFSALLPPDPPKPEVVLSFLAVLELTKFGALTLTQAEQFSELHLYVTPNFARLKKSYPGESGAV